VSLGESPEHTAEWAFLDANVIRGQLTTDLLLSLAEQDLLEPFWSEGVIDEMRRNRPEGVTEERIDRRIAAMNRYFPDAMVSGHEALIPQMPADAKDRHVLAAAVHGECDVLITDNIKDFHPPSAGPYAMRVERLSEFLSRKLHERPDTVTRALRGMVDRNRRDPRSMEALIGKMTSMPELRGFARVLGEHTAGVDNDVQKQAAVAFDGLSAPGGGASVATGDEQTSKSQSKDRDRGPER
jgi:predicted nucleic acid-binding protein